MHRSSLRRLRATAASVAALALLLVGCTTTEEDSFSYTPPAQAEGALPEDTIAQLQAAIENAMVTTGSSGAIAGVWVPWSGSWVTGLGTQGGDDAAPVTKDMSFRVADVTRMMTCDVLYGLADDGLVEVTDQASDYISGAGELAGVTLLDLCNGTSGLGMSEPSVVWQWLNTPERQWAPLELASFGLAGSDGEPGVAFRDSDASYLILGLALERISGKSVEQLIADYVTGPLGLSNTSLPESEPAEPAGTPLRGHYLPAVEGGYACQEPVDVTKLSASIGFTDSGVVSTVEDLGRYVQAEARRALRAEDAEPDQFGSALQVSSAGPSWVQAGGGAYLIGSLIGQHGTIPGYATAAYADPATGLTVVVVLNNSTAGAGVIAGLSWELAAIASKAPAAAGQTAPEFGLPFTAEQYHNDIASIAICQPAA